MVISNQKIYNEYTKNKKEETKSNCQRSPSLEEGRGKEKRKRRLQNTQKINNIMAKVSPYSSIITLNVNGLSSPIKRQTEWIKKRPMVLLPTRTALHL